MIGNTVIYLLTVFLIFPFTAFAENPGTFSGKGLESKIPGQAESYLTENNPPDMIGSDEYYEPEEAFRRANELYIEGKYKEAIPVYEGIVDSGYHFAGLYYNLANAYYRSSEIPPAILNYERARLLAPGDEDISFNLDMARMHVRDRIEELPVFFLNRWWKQARDSLNAGTWASISVATFIFSLVLLSVFLVSSSVVTRKIFFWMALLFFLSSILSFTFGLDQRNHLKNHNTAIVFAPAVQVKSSPDINSPDLFVIHEGTKVRIEDSIGDWRAVRLSDGNKGWLRKDAVEMI